MKKTKTRKLRQRNRRRFFKELFLFCLLMALLTGGYLFFKSNFLRIQKVECFFDGQRCSNQVWAGVFEILKGKSSVSISQQSFLSALKEKYPYVRNAEIEIRSPRAVVVKLEKRVAIGNFVFISDFPLFTQLPLKPSLELKKISGLTGYPNWQVDENGVIFSSNQANNQLPLILLVPEKAVKVESGAQIQSYFQADIINLLIHLAESSLQPDTVIVSEEKNIAGIISSGWEALISTEKEIVFQVDSLQLILGRAKIEGRLPKLVDLRFNKPVVSY